ncbi:MAG: HyaD/HybD family hydrogenase maturation endopeptidase [Proteobacteria bacterium]|nr:HyaD/HybD family hydrogenase maturation endopeptidase [Pseudomonadota bacterium]MBU1717039.1 HyaD/HybD family hydrogenase maturation endopeptidase [Pseudomonadota bacterium]
MTEPEDDFNVLVLGVGNLLLSDEGIGPRIISELLNYYHIPAGVEVVDGGTMGYDLLPYLAGRSHLFIVDAFISEKIPGTVSRIELEDAGAFFRNRMSPHQLGMADVLAVATMTDELPPSVILFGIEPATLDSGLELSAEVKVGAEKLRTMLLAELKFLGADFVRKEHRVADINAFPLEVNPVQG